jgi:dynein heavy chain
MGLLADTDEVKDVTRMNESILSSLKAYEDERFLEWDKTVDVTLADKLTLPLITRDPKSAEITVNFDDDLVKLLNECKYFVIQKKNIPEVAQSLFANVEVFRVQTANLTLIQNMYNEMLRKMLDVEKPLLKGQMKAIDKVLDKGLKQLVWKSPNAEKDDFIKEAHELVKEAHQNLFEIKANMEGVIAILNKWVAAPLISRQSVTKTYNLVAYMEEHAKTLEARQKDITDGAKEVHNYLKASNEVLKVSKGAPAWRAYVEFINGILVDGIADTVVASLGNLLGQIDPKQIEEGGKSPFFDVKLDLNPAGKGDDAVFFKPPLAGDDPENPSVMFYVHTIMSDFYNIIKLIKRLDRTEGDFLKEMEENEAVRFNSTGSSTSASSARRRARSTRSPSSSTARSGPRTFRIRCRPSSRRRAWSSQRPPERRAATAVMARRPRSYPRSRPSRRASARCARRSSRSRRSTRRSSRAGSRLTPSQ